ncbi:hypothetical protein HMI48_00055 [Acidithiobacillus ferrooxidans]|uniref:hypothetical protein n=1 Tax=Acidithiobacillus ferrooxidans TaxID=920 RepID=UPI001C07EE3A|nr:hypothetical protein [Acidithiobacillus ferrooxidans]MBU2772376.1 hypothetical protein [Acidithiobacillus ferrooxidans]
MESLLEEVNHGITIMKNRQRTLLPVKSWYGVKTVSNDVLLRIIAVSMNITKKRLSTKRNKNTLQELL